MDFITVDTQSVLLDISALGGEYCLAVEMLGQPSTVLVRNGDYNTLPRNPLLMGRDEFAVLLQVDGVDGRSRRSPRRATWRRSPW